MTASHSTKTDGQLWSDLLVALGGDEAFLTRSLSERDVLLEILDTYHAPVSLRNVNDADAILARVVVAAGGTASHLRQSKHEMLAALVMALGGTAPSPSTSSIGELLAAAVNAASEGGGGGGEVPEWAPENSKIYIDLVSDRAWTEADGEVEIITLLGADVNTENSQDSTEFYPESLTVDGYVITGGQYFPAFIGVARTSAVAGATVVLKFKTLQEGDAGINYLLVSADGNDALEVDLLPIESSDNAMFISSWSGSLNETSPDVANVGADAINLLAFTMTSTRLEAAANGSAVISGEVEETDRPSGNPLVAVWLGWGQNIRALQSITIYDALPSTAGLSALSVVS